MCVASPQKKSPHPFCKEGGSKPVHKHVYLLCLSPLSKRMELKTGIIFQLCSFIVVNFSSLWVEHINARLGIVFCCCCSLQSTFANKWLFEEKLSNFERHIFAGQSQRPEATLLIINNKKWQYFKWTIGVAFNRHLKFTLCLAVRYFLLVEMFSVGAISNTNIRFTSNWSKAKFLHIYFKKYEYVRLWCLLT